MSDDSHSGDQSTWRLPWVGLRAARVTEALTPLAEKLGGLSLAVEEEEPGSITVTLGLPPNPETGDEASVELSFYNLGDEGVVMSLEAEFADNEHVWDTAWDVADSIASELGAGLLEL